MSQSSTSAENEKSTYINYPVTLISVICLLALATPAALVAVPPLTDYPNHLARFWILMRGMDVPAVADSYVVTWSTLTNIGVDVLAYWSRSLVDYERFGRVMVALAVVAVPAGTALLWSAVHGGRSAWQFAAGLLAWSAGLFGGFLNFEISLGLAMMVAALDPPAERRGPLAAAACRILGGLLLLAVHPFGFVFYACLLAGLAVGPSLAPLVIPAGRRAATLRLAAVVAALLVPACLFVLATPVLPGTQSETDLPSLLRDLREGITGMSGPSKLKGVFVGVLSYSLAIDAITVVVLAFPVTAALLAGRLRCHAGLALAACGVFLLFVLLPPQLAGTGWVDRRFALMLPLVATVALRPELPARTARLAAMLLIDMAVLRTGFVAWVWHDRQADVLAVSHALDGVPPTSRLLPLQQVPRIEGRKAAPIGRFSISGETSYGHLPTMALPWRHAAFVPTVFAVRGKQPLEVAPRWIGIAEPEGGAPPSPHALLRAPTPSDPDYLTGWRRNFDYAIVVGTDMPDQEGPFAPPQGLVLVRDTGFARLYRIVPPG